MTAVLKSAVFAAALALRLVAGVGTADAAKCVKAGGTADMITEDLARFMANAALENQIKANGWKGVGPVSMSCKAGAPINCTATQKACK